MKKHRVEILILAALSVLIAVLFIADFKIVSATHSNFDLANLREISSTSTLAYDKIKIQPAWEFIKGLTSTPPFAEVIIGVLDTGLDISHPEFVGVNLGQTPSAITKGSHGTAVAGIIGANNISATSSVNYVFPQMNGIVSGVLPKEKYVLGVRAASISLRPALDFEAPLDELIAGQAQLINISLGAAKGEALTDAAQKTLNHIPDAFFNDYAQFFSQYFNEHDDVLFVISAGNENVTSTDAAFIAQSTSTENVIIIGAIELDDTRTSGVTDSGVEFGSVYGPGVSLTAPGEGIYVPAIKRSPQNDLNFNDYWHPFNTTPTSTDPNDVRRFFSDTSGATAQVTGVAAILKSINPSLSPSEIKHILIRTADPIQTGELDKRLGTGCYADPNDPINTGCRLNALRAVQDILGIPAIPDIRGLYIGTAISSQTNCQNPADNITVSWPNVSINISNQSNGVFNATGPPASAYRG